MFGTLEFENGGILRINTSFALNIQADKVLDVQLCGDEAGANLYPGKIYTDQAGELKVIKQIESKETNNHLPV